MNKQIKTIAIAISAAVMTVNVFAQSVPFNQANSMIKNIYTKYVFGHADYNKQAIQLGTARFNHKLASEYDYDCDQSPCYALYALRTDAQDGEGASKVVKVTPLKNDWYRVNYLDMGWKGVTDIKIIRENGKAKFDDYKFVSDNVR